MEGKKRKKQEKEAMEAQNKMIKIILNMSVITK